MPPDKFFKKVKKFPETEACLKKHPFAASTADSADIPALNIPKNKLRAPRPLLPYSWSVCNHLQPRNREPGLCCFIRAYKKVWIALNAGAFFCPYYLSLIM